MSSQSYDFLILGQGLAGSILAWHLINAKKRVMVIDDGHQSSSSIVAAGMVNPVAGRSLNSPPRTADWLKSAHAFYAHLGKFYQQAYFHPVDMQRIFQSDTHIRYYQRQRENNPDSPYIGKTLKPKEVDTGIQAPYGAFEQTQTGYLDMPQILADLKDWLLEKQALINHSFTYDAIKVTQESIQFGDIEAQKLIFCEGYRVIENPWFRQLPFQPDKGEMLRLKTSKTICTHIANGVQWMIPLANGDYRLGATHEHEDINCQATDHGRAELLAGLENLLKDNSGINVTEHNAGVRPATQDRQPFIGAHPRLPGLHIFNGFGGRGALTIPWFSERYAEHLLNHAKLPSEADVIRYQDIL